jgi:dienelactone hydrolase
MQMRPIILQNQKFQIMKNGKCLLGALSALVLLFSSCQKDTISAEQTATSTENNSIADDVIETTPPVWSSVQFNVNSNVAGFWQGIPARYSTTTKKYPLIVFIHGIGELGTSLSRMNCCGLPKHLYNKTFPANFNVGGANHSFLVIAPQFKVRPSAAQVQSVIDYARAKWRVDDTRIYVTGLSMGGGSTWDWSSVYGEKAAAIVPVCGGTKPTTTLASKLASKNLPIWGLYSSADAVVPVQWGRDWFSWIDAANPTYASKTKLTIWTDATHNRTWGRAFHPQTRVDGFNIYEWMLLFKRGTSGSVAAPAPAPAPTEPAEPTDPVNTGNQLPTARAGADRVIPLDWNYMPTIWGNTSTDPDGRIVSWKWTKISGPASFSINTPFANYTKLTGLVEGTYVFRLTVTDDDGGVSTDDISITMTGKAGTGTAGNQAPIARAGVDRVIDLGWKYMPTIWGNTSTDPDGRIVSYKWTKISGPAQYTMLTPNSNYTKVVNLVAGTYVFRLTVTDDDGAVSTDDVEIKMVP